MSITLLFLVEYQDFMYRIIFRVKVFSLTEHEKKSLHEGQMKKENDVMTNDVILSKLC